MNISGKAVAAAAAFGIAATLLAGLALAWGFLNDWGGLLDADTDDDIDKFEIVVDIPDSKDEPVGVIERDGSATFHYGVGTDLELNAMRVLDSQALPLAIHFPNGYEKPAELIGGDLGRKVDLGVMVDANDEGQKCLMEWEVIVDYKIEGELDPFVCAFAITLTVFPQEATLTSSECPDLVTEVIEPTGLAMASTILQPHVPNGKIIIADYDYDATLKVFSLEKTSTNAGNSIFWHYQLENIDLPQNHSCTADYKK